MVMEYITVVSMVLPLETFYTQYDSIYDGDQTLVANIAFKYNIVNIVDMMLKILYPNFETFPPQVFHCLAIFY